MVALGVDRVGDLGRPMREGRLGGLGGEGPADLGRGGVPGCGRVRLVSGICPDRFSAIDFIFTARAAWSETRLRAIERGLLAKTGPALCWPYGDSWIVASRANCLCAAVTDGSGPAEYAGLPVRPTGRMTHADCF